MDAVYMAVCRRRIHIYAVFCSVYVYGTYLLLASAPHGYGIYIYAVYAAYITDMMMRQAQGLDRASPRGAGSLVDAAPQGAE